MKMTQLRLVDGDGNQIHARLAINLAEVGRMLKRGDKKCLDLFTELRYRVNKTSPRMPALFISKMTRAGFSLLTDAGIKGMITCSSTSILPNEDSDEFEPSDDRVIDPRIHDKPMCTDENRICAVYGLWFVRCVCEVLPVEKHNLETIKEGCYFSTDKLNDMLNSHKRNMLFWWYSTNVFLIAGKGKRGKNA